MEERMNDFIYDDNISYLNNFDRWYMADTISKELMQQKSLGLEEAQNQFKKMYGYKILEESVFN
jgi:hypothetical protein